MRQITKKMALMICAGVFIAPACYFGGGDSFDSNLILPSQTNLASEVESSSSGRRGGGGKCEDSGDCEDICEEVYDYDDPEAEELNGRVEACLDLKYRLAVKFEELFDALKEPSSAGLRNIDEKTFAEFLDISVGPWVAITGEANDDEAEALLAWIAQKTEISQAVANAYKNYEPEYDQFEGVESLFDELSGDCSAAIAGGKTFEDIACEKKDNYALAIYENICGGVISCRGRHAYNRPDDFPSDLFYKRGKQLLKYAVNVENVLYICPEDTTDAEINSLRRDCAAESLSAQRNCSEARDAGCRVSQQIGSGVLIDNNIVLTNHHVVDTRVKTLTVPSDTEGEDPTTYKTFMAQAGAVSAYSGDASLVYSIQWYDADSDLALLRLRDNLSFDDNLEFGCLRELSVRDKLITIGQPNGRQWVISQGVLRSKSADTFEGPGCLHCSSYDFPDVVLDAQTRLFSSQDGVEHDQPGILGGASGSPIFNEAGKLVGLIATATGTASRSRGWGYGPHIGRIRELIDTFGLRNSRINRDVSQHRGVDNSCS